MSIYLYKVIGNFGNVFKTNYFTEHSVVTDALVKLINPEGDSTTPTYTVTASSINDIYREIRDKIFLIHENGLNELNPQYENDDMHPFYFRPTKKFKSEPLTNQEENNNRQIIFNNINYQPQN